MIRSPLLTPLGSVGTAAVPAEVEISNSSKSLQSSQPTEPSRAH